VIRAECGKEITMKRGDPVRCRECGYRILYKKRTAKGLF
jgi:DNA-directed RNA polymerase I, II, and III subunit RPABC4